MLPAAFTTRASLATVLPSSLAALSGAANDLGLPRLDKVVVVVVDGLGAAALRARGGHARTLAPALSKAATIDSGFPTTTAAALTTLTTGTTPGEHGMVGYRVRDAAGRVLALPNDTINAALVNLGTIVSQGGTTVTGGLDNAAGATLRVLGNSRYASAGLSVTTGLTNEGSIELISADSTYSASLTVTGGPLVNLGTVAASVGSGGSRTLNARLDNRAGGSLTAAQPLSLNLSGSSSNARSLAPMTRCCGSSQEPSG